MNRRQFVLRGGVLLALAAGAGVAVLPRSGSASLLDMDAVYRLLDDLQGSALVAVSGWSPAKVFHHCAQSIEFSLMGFPQMKPAWFRRSAGPLAFTVFNARGAMRHPLDEPIPGAAELSDNLEQATAVERLRLAFERFAEHKGPLHPHFAYGELSHAEYQRAHIMHLAEHMSLIRRV